MWEESSDGAKKPRPASRTYECHKCKAEMKSQNSLGLCQECRMTECKNCGRKFIRRLKSFGEQCSYCRFHKLEREY